CHVPAARYHEAWIASAAPMPRRRRGRRAPVPARRASASQSAAPITISTAIPPLATAITAAAPGSSSRELIQPPANPNRGTAVTRPPGGTAPRTGPDERVREGAERAGGRAEAGEQAREPQDREPIGERHGVDYDSRALPPRYHLRPMRGPLAAAAAVSLAL